MKHETLVLQFLGWEAVSLHITKYTVIKTGVVLNQNRRFMCPDIV